ncbi:MAG: AAA family ATPase [Lachnospiraceae bacterium]|nr:AAA family ATPase [Lachnospiraceae bacterium]
MPPFRLRFEAVEDKKLVVLDIFAGEETPYYYAADGVMEAYTRIGNESVLVDATEHKRLVLRGKKTSFDTQSSGYKLDDFSFSELRARYKKVTGKSFDDKNFESFGIADKDGVLTYAGALLADESPIRYSCVFCRRWNGLTKSGGLMDSIDSDELEGGLIHLLNESTAFIRRNMRVMWRKLSNTRENYPDYQERAYFEALVNGLIHRDYLITGSEVHVDMFDDRLEIVSLGGMVEGKPVQNYDIDHIPSMRRNPVLADIFSRLDYMERSGSGLSKIRDAQKNSANYAPDKQPSFYSDRSQFVITMPNLNYENEKIRSILAENDREQVAGQVTCQVAGQVTDQDMGQVIGQVTWKDLAEYCKLPRTRAEMQDYCGLSGRANFRENHLKLLLEKGAIKMTIPDKPNSKNQRYYSEYAAE